MRSHRVKLPHHARAHEAVLIRDVEIRFRERVDIRVEHGVIADIGRGLPATRDEVIIEAHGAALLPGLHDHHLHLRSLAAALASVHCGPPRVRDADGLALCLRNAANDPGRRAGDWTRGVAYHESVAGNIDRDWLDQHVGDRPLRIQHRSGRLWILNSRALQLLGVPETAADTPLERVDGRFTGRLYDADIWLRERLGSNRQSLREVSRRLASFGITGLTDTTPGNTRDDFVYFQAAQTRGELLQDILVMGDASLDELSPDMTRDGVARGPRKFHLHDADLPDFETLCVDIRGSHRARRTVAFHCVTRTDLAYALAALREAGCVAGDRIEHASVTPPELLAQIVELGLTVVTQPNFITERGDAYLQDVAGDDQPWLYRLRGFLDAGIALAGSTDAPFGEANPWKAMQAAVSRRTASGVVISANEALSPEEALELFISPLNAPGRETRKIEPGQPADLCLLDRPWSAARNDLAEVRVRLTLKRGQVIWQDDL